MPRFELSKNHVHPETGEVRLRSVPAGDNSEATGRKPRITEYRTVVKGAVPDAVEIEMPQTVAFFRNGFALATDASSVAVSYERLSKSAKIITKVDSVAGKLAVCPNLALMDYDALIAVDTNTIMLNGVAVSITCVVQFFLKEDGNGVILYSAAPHRFEFNNIQDKPENYAWREVVRQLLRSPDYTPQKKITVVVDSDLGSIDEYNSGVKPLFEDFFLPENIQLVYASSEIGTTEYAANGIMKFCDTEASAVLRFRQTQDFPPLPQGYFRTYKKEFREESGTGSDF